MEKFGKFQSREVPRNFGGKDTYSGAGTGKVTRWGIGINVLKADYLPETLMRLIARRRAPRARSMSTSDDRSESLFSALSLAALARPTSISSGCSAVSARRITFFPSVMRKPPLVARV